MGHPDFPRSIMDFQDCFATEAACLEYLAACRWPEGFVCPACGGRSAQVLERRAARCIRAVAARFTQATTQTGAIVHTDGLQFYRAIAQTFLGLSTLHDSTSYRQITLHDRAA